MQYFLKTV